MAASTKVITTARVPGDRRRVIAQITCDNSYEEKGEKVPVSEFGLTRATDAICNVVNSSESETIPVSGAFYNVETERLILIDGKKGKEVEKEKDMSKVVVQIMINGI